MSPPKVTVNINTTTSSSIIRFNPSYLKMASGIFKLLQLLFAIVCMSCASPALKPGTSWFLFVVVICFLCTLFWLFAHLVLSSFSDIKACVVPCLFIELGYTIVATVLYFTAFIVQLAIWAPTQNSDTDSIHSNVVAGIFAVFNFVIYALASYILNKEMKSSEIAAVVVI